jgi:signal transduction histidine kinase/CheY-like chemotaxis protein
MRRETDFVLEKAAWPALLVEEAGRICRANLSARHVFGFTDQFLATSLSAIWDEDPAIPPIQFLEKNAAGGTAPLKLRLHSGQKAQFIAHVAKIVREEQNYFVLQLFKDSGTSFPELAHAPVTATAPPPEKIKPPDAAPEKKDPEFLLQKAEWPALVIQQNGRVTQANRAAAQTFGPAVEKADAQLSAIWSSQNSRPWQQLFKESQPLEPTPLTLQLKSGMPGVFLGQLCGSTSEGAFVLQLLKPPALPVAVAPAAPPAVDTKTPEPKGAEANLAHKQKLDCALQLARSVALDFNNALTTILGHTSLLLSKAEAGNPWRGSLGEIEKSAARAAEIANDLAAFSRQEKDVRVQVSGNLNLLLERTMEAFQGSLQKPITMTRQLERKLFTANFDEAKMQQALVKLFENAVEAINASGKINVQTRNLELTETTQDRTARLNPGTYVCVEVSDTGSGIAEDILPRIFEPFFTTKGATHRGLGLAWVYGIVTNHGGGVAVSSQPTIGTTVRLYLPANRKIVREAPVSDGDLSGTQTILLVDDEDLLLTMGQMVLSSYGYTVLMANSGQKALELFTHATKPIDLVITDLVMPNMSGRELTEHILKSNPKTRIIWSSGYVRSSNAPEEEMYLQKPFTSQDLLRKVKQALAQ